MSFLQKLFSSVTRNIRIYTYAVRIGKMIFYMLNSLFADYLMTNIQWKCRYFPINLLLGGLFTENIEYLQFFIIS